MSVADRMDTIAGCFSVGLIPTGAADPYTLRRNVLGIIQILINLDKPVDLPGLIHEAVSQIGAKRTREADLVEADVTDFIRTRFVNFHTGREFPLDVVEAVVRARFDDLVDARRRVEALAVWKHRPDFDAIMIGFKRVMNILKDSKPARLSESLLTEPAERELYEAFERIIAGAGPLIEKGDYGSAFGDGGRAQSPD